MRKHRKEVESRLNSLSQDKKDWLEDNGFTLISDLDVLNCDLNTNGNVGYSIEYLESATVEELEAGEKHLRNIRDGKEDAPINT